MEVDDLFISINENDRVDAGVYGTLIENTHF